MSEEEEEEYYIPAPGQRYAEHDVHLLPSLWHPRIHKDTLPGKSNSKLGQPAQK